MANSLVLLTLLGDVLRLSKVRIPWLEGKELERRRDRDSEIIGPIESIVRWRPINSIRKLIIVLEQLAGAHKMEIPRWNLENQELFFFLSHLTSAASPWRSNICAVRNTACRERLSNALLCKSNYRGSAKIVETPDFRRYLLYSRHALMKPQSFKLN